MHSILRAKPAQKAPCLTLSYRTRLPREHRDGPHLPVWGEPTAPAFGAGEFMNRNILCLLMSSQELNSSQLTEGGKPRPAGRQLSSAPVQAVQ